MEEVAKKCPTCGQYPRRSREQERLYWALMQEMERHATVRGHKFDRWAWHIQIKRDILGMEEFRLPNGRLAIKDLESPKGTKEYAEFFDKVQAFCAGYGVALPEMESQ